MLSYTIFYTGLIYLPLRFASDIVGRMQDAARRKQALRKAPALSCYIR